MGMTSRREALGRIAVATGGALCASLPVAAHAATMLALPAGPMRLTRRIERSMEGEAMLSVERSWQVGFARSGQGIAITGEQVEAVVEAPESLAPLAAIEQSRITDDMWPIMLSEKGRVMASGGGVRPRDLSAAIREAEAMIARMEIPAAEAVAMTAFLARLQQAGSSLLDTLPEDLFYPVRGPMRQTRQVALPGDMTGEFEITYDAKADSANGWLERAERIVITRIGASERRARELWTLADIGP